MIDRLWKLEPDRSKADSVAEKTALHALWRDPLGILGIGWRTYVGYWNVATMKKYAVADFSFRRPPGDKLIGQWFALSSDICERHKHHQRYSVVLHCGLALLLPHPVSASALWLAIALRSVRRYAILLFVHISIMMAMAMTFGGDSIRYLQPISFMTLLVLALGTLKSALRSVRKDEAIAGWQSSSVETLRPDLNALVQPS